MNRISVNTSNVLAEKEDLFGIFFEDINHAADGGLYAEMVRNRSFEFSNIDNDKYDSLTAWKQLKENDKLSNMSIATENPLRDVNPHYLVFENIDTNKTHGFFNEGYNEGFNIEKNNIYDLTFYAKKLSNITSNNEKIAFEVKLAGKSITYSTAKFDIDSEEWTQYSASMKSDGNDNGAKLVFETHNACSIAFDFISLFPRNTFMNRKNGMRKDIAEKLLELKPKFMRFPGGCLIHDGAIDENARDSMYRWKKTIGPLIDRPARRNNWRYNQTLGLGYFEYFQFCEDINTKPIPVLPAGFNPHRQIWAEIKDLKPWIQDALDLIEFANGDESSVWGKKRIELGHEKPFNLEYIGIGNEEIGDKFYERYAIFHKVIKEAYPDIKIINSAGPFAAGIEYEKGWTSARENNSDLIDEHYYMNTEWFLGNIDRYKNFKAEESKVFLGEYATWGNTYYNALVEAAFMTGLENASHAVKLACYAPMLANVDYVNWKPDMIWFNNHQVYGSANYYIQKMFMLYQGDRLLESNLVEAQDVTDINKSVMEYPNNLLHGDIVFNANKATLLFEDIKLVNTDTNEEKVLCDDFELKGIEKQKINTDEICLENYKLTFKLTKKEGFTCFKLQFAYIDEENYDTWEFGGWENQDCLISATKQNRGACLHQRAYRTELNHTYDMVLEVKGRDITTYVDGKKMNWAEDAIPAVRPIYFSASYDTKARLYSVKVVNVTSLEQTTSIELDNLNTTIKNAKLISIYGHKLNEENTFKQPENIIPVELPIEFMNTTTLIKIAPYSVNIITFML